MSTSTISLHELPAPPPGCTGWPWTDAPSAPAQTTSGDDWPRITVVTPSFNQARYLEATIRSVLLQGYPALEYVVLDAGSTDGSVDIIRRYERWLSRWRSHRDDGHAAAVAEGWNAASGDVVAYLNSDDIYMPGALAAAAEYLASQPELSGVAGTAVQIDEHGQTLGLHHAQAGSFDELLDLNFIPQPAVFVRRAAVDAAGGVDPALRYAFDLDMWLRLARQAPIGVVSTVLAATRLHPDTVTATGRRETARELGFIAGKLHRQGLLTRRQHARLLGGVAFVTTSIHMDGLPLSLHRALAAACAGALRHPPTLLRLAGAALRRASRGARA